MGGTDDKIEGKTDELKGRVQQAGGDLTGDQDPIRVFGLRASASLFPMLGVRPILGRFFRNDEEQSGKNHVAVLGDRVPPRHWHR